MSGALDRPEWHARAYCGRNGNIGDDPEKRVRRMFLRLDATVCVGCPVADDCARAGRYVARLKGTGVWAGRAIGSRVRSCEICGDEFTSRDRRVTCSELCALEKSRRAERKRSAEARARKFAEACCEICGRVRHDRSCPEFKGHHRKGAA